MELSGRPLRIDVISDVVCPWCYVGKRKLETALAQFGQQERVEVRWHPFELNPDLPPEGIPRAVYVTRKFGAARAPSVYAQVRRVGEQVGIPFAFDRILQQPNTRDAHRLIAWAQARTHDVSSLVERLFVAFFCEGRSLAGPDALADIAAEAGHDREQARAHLSSTDGTRAVVAAEQRAHALGVQSVPFFVFAEHVSVSGAQSADILLRALARAAAHAD